jgi:hypothetical protein
MGGKPLRDSIAENRGGVPSWSRVADSHRIVHRPQINEMSVIAVRRVLVHRIDMSHPMLSSKDRKFNHESEKGETATQKREAGCRFKLSQSIPDFESIAGKNGWLPLVGDLLLPRWIGKSLRST